MSNVEKNHYEYVVILRAPAASIFERGKSIKLNVPREDRNILLTFRSRQLDMNLDVPIPGDLWIEGRIIAKSIEEAVTACGNAAATVLPVISLTTNASIGNMIIELAFECTPGKYERDYLQVFVPGERGILSRARIIDIETVLELLNAIENHSEKDRLLRATTQHHLALKHWRHGEEILATAHLYIGCLPFSRVNIR